MNDQGERLIRAAYTDETITVYQAYSPHIADAAVAAGRFVPPFSRERMTWIKPSFGWMMQRCGWASKPGQERVLAISLRRSGLEWALEHACLSHFEPGTHASHGEWEAIKTASPVRIQWDPDRSLTGERLSRRAIQIGLSGPAVRRYADEWVTGIRDITALARQTEDLIRAGRIAEAAGHLPTERVYPLSPPLAARIGADPSPEPAGSGSLRECGARP
jgi:Domain of unknown function (DUF4291)